VCQGIHGDLRPLFRHGGQHDHRHFHELGLVFMEEFHAVHFRHFQIQDYYIGVEIGDFREGELAVHGLAGQMEIVGAFDDAAHQIAHQS
jgi:hypothetical protein